MRRKARALLLQALYQWEVSKNSAREILQGFLSEINFKKVDAVFFEQEFLEIVEKQKFIDEKFTSFLDRPIEQLDLVELTILRIGTYEITVAMIPYKVAINEALELSKKFGSVDGYRFINKVLDRLSQTNGYKDEKVKEL